MFLTEPQLEELTGYRQWSAQRKWLIQAGIPHYRRRDGRPIVTRTAVEGTVTPRLVQNPEDLPDFSAIRRGGHGKAAQI
jgi:Domain of unknown function (DUF4224)